MASVPSPTTARQRSSSWTYALLLSVHIITSLIASSKVWGDTIRYVGDVVARAGGEGSQFWEFGHLLWRPWGYVGYLLFSPAFGQWFGDTPAQAVTRFFVITNFFCTAGVLVLLLWLARRVAGPTTALALVIALSLSNALIDYRLSGASYLPALLFSTAAVCLVVWAVDATSHWRVKSIWASGIAFAWSTALWFPFAVTGLGMIALIVLWPASGVRDDRRGRIRLVAHFLAALAGTSLILFGAGAAAAGVGSVSELRAWIDASKNGIEQSRSLMRAVTGVVRMLWDLGGDPVRLKRWLFHDPYNSASLGSLVISMGGKLALFYLGITAALFVLAKVHRDILWILIAAGIPMLVFAVFLFEPSSPERFMPLFPFLCLAFGAVLNVFSRYRRILAVLVILLAATSLTNLAGRINIWGRDSSLAGTRARLQALNAGVQPGALVFVLSFNDDLYQAALTHPLDDDLSTAKFRLRDTVEVASVRTRGWRSEFAGAVRDYWGKGKDVWVSERLLAQRPEPDWLWVELDDPSVRWADIPSAFRELEFDTRIGAAPDGFLRLARSDKNMKQLNNVWAVAQRAARTGGE